MRRTDRTLPKVAFHPWTRNLSRSVTIESLESRVLLDASGFAGNPCVPDLEIDETSPQVVRANETLQFNLFDGGFASVEDLDGIGLPSGDTIRLQLDPDDNPSNATLTADGDFRWTPTTDQVGTVEFVVIAIDSGNPPLADAETFTVEVRSDEAPDLAAIPDVTAAVNELVTIDLSATDADGDIIAVNVDLEDTPIAVSLSPSVGEIPGEYDGQLQFTPGPELAGQSFSITVIATSTVDGGDETLSDSETFALNVVSVIAVEDDFAFTAGTEDFSVGAEQGVLANDTDVSGSALTVAVSEDPINGSLTLSPDGSFTYQPNDNFVGDDTFTYIATNEAGESAVGSANITINALAAANTAPTAIDDTFETDEGVVLEILAEGGVLANDTDAEFDILEAQIVSLPSNGQLVLNPDGSFTYTPLTGFSGVDSFRYTASDGTENSATATAVVLVRDVNDPPQGIADDFDVAFNETLTVGADESVLLNDTDSENDTLTATVATQPTNGTLDFDSDGTFVYTPNTDFVGTDSFTYEVSDGESSGAETVVVSIEVLEPNQFSVSATAVSGDSVGSVTTTENFTSDVIYQFDDGAIPDLLLLNADDHIEGDPAAAVTLIEYFDFQ